MSHQSWWTLQAKRRHTARSVHVNSCQARTAARHLQSVVVVRQARVTVQVRLPVRFPLRGRETSLGLVPRFRTHGRCRLRGDSSTLGCCWPLSSVRSPFAPTAATRTVAVGAALLA